MLTSNSGSLLGGIVVRCVEDKVSKRREGALIRTPTLIQKLPKQADGRICEENDDAWGIPDDTRLFTTATLFSFILSSLTSFGDSGQDIRLGKGIKHCMSNGVDFMDRLIGQGFSWYLFIWEREPMAETGYAYIPICNCGLFKQVQPTVTLSNDPIDVLPRAVSLRG